MTDDKYVPSKKVEEILDSYRLMDDDFMTLFFDQNFEATELLLNIILNRKDIKVKSMEVQKIEKNPLVGGRNVILEHFNTERPLYLLGSAVTQFTGMDLERIASWLRKMNKEAYYEDILEENLDTRLF